MRRSPCNLGGGGGGALRLGAVGFGGVCLKVFGSGGGGGWLRLFLVLVVVLAHPKGRGM